MNKSMRTKKLVAALILACTLLMSMAVTVFAEDGAGKDYLSDPKFFQFIFLVIGFFAAIVCVVMIYFAVKNSKQEREYEESEGTVKLYEDLDDAKWDAPDSVFLDALEPNAAILNELEPAKPVRGLNGFVITEGPIDPVQAINMGADPYAYKTGEEEITNGVFEATPSTPITAADMVAPVEEPAPEVERERSFFYEPQPSPL